MPVAKGQPWGEEGTLEPGATILPTDASLSRAVEWARTQNQQLSQLGLVGGDLWRTLGAPPGGADRLRNGPATRVTVDVGWVRFDGGETEHAFVAHCIVRTRTWSSVIAVMNAEWVERWDVAPRSHPGDGWLDVLEADLAWRERDKVRRRLPTGTHLPHPQIRTSRVRRAEFSLDRPTRLYLDGAPFPKVRSLEVRIEPASLTVLV